MRDIWKNRILAAGGVGLLLLLMRLCEPAVISRQESLYLFALPLGYGHLLGAALFSRSRSPGTSSLLTTAFVAVSVLTLLTAYIWALDVPGLQMVVLVPMLLLSAWHIVENDLALARSYREGLRLGPVPRGVRHHALALAWTAAVGALALSTLTGAQFSVFYLGRISLPIQTLFSLDELATAVLLYHAFSWILFFEDRAKTLPRVEARRLRERLLALHAIPLVLNAALYLWLPAIHFYVAAPTLYLFWSALHAVQTAAVRGFEPHSVRVCASA